MVEPLNIQGGVPREAPPSASPGTQNPKGPLEGLRGRLRRLVASESWHEQVCLAFPTRTRTDTGLWFRSARVWAFCLRDRLALVAAGKRPYVETLAFADLRQSLYNHVMGELVLAPAGGARVRRLRIPPLEARKLLERIGAGGAPRRPTET